MSVKKKKITPKRKVHQELLLCESNSKDVENSRSDLSIAENNDNQSQKRQRINQSLCSKLHTLTSTEQIVVPARIPGRVTGSKNSNVWDFKMGTSNRETSSQISDSISNPSIPPCVENLRHRYVSESRDYLKKLCKEHNVIPPLMAWERWQANCILTQQLTYRDSDANGSSDNVLINFTSCNNIYTRKVRSNTLTAVDLILPDNIGNPDQGIVEDLMRGGFSDETIASKVSKQMSDHSHDLVTKIRSFEHACRASTGLEKKATLKKKKGQQQQNNAAASNNTLPTVVEHKHTFDVSLGKKSKHILKLNCAHCMKLKELYILTQQQNRSMDSSSAASEIKALTAENIVDDEVVDSSVQGFHCALFNLLARYNALLGHGMQCALPEDVFQVLHKWVQTNFECFASPLNCRYSSYCSAFPDTDAVFGSKGSFFDFYPTRGSYEVNPPFIESVMTAAVQHAHSLLEKSDDALSFVFIMPGWTESSAYQLLQESAHRTLCVAVAAKDHGYCSGAQHQRKDRYLEAPYDTIVFILQNEQGRRVHSASTSTPSGAAQFEEELRAAFSTAIPTEAMKQRRLKEGRGFGDLDGGGGVYKGKKQNKKSS